MPTETTLVTGASSGIGWELAKLFAADQSNLVLVARRREKLEQLAEQLHSDHQVNVTVLVQDLATPAGPATLQQQLQDRDITIDALVNNAGCGTVGKFTEMSGQLEMLQLNVATLTDLARRFLPGMLERGRGSILNVASTAAFQPGANMAVYFATKAYVLSFSEALAAEARGTGVRISCLCPGPTKTEFISRSGFANTLLYRLGTMEASTVAQRGYRAIRNGKTVEVPGVINQLVVFSLRVTPRWIVRRIAARLMSNV